MTSNIKRIDSYMELKNASLGDVISIKGKKPEVIIDPVEEFKDSFFFKNKDWKKHKLYSVGVEDIFLVLNQYDLYSKENSNIYLNPYFKMSCRIHSGTPLENGLAKILEREDLL